MDLDQLHTFLEIVRLKSFSKAAQSCFRTQPAVSAQVRQLEQELNAPLFERLGTVITLDESLLGVALGVCSVGPAYQALLLEAQVDAAVRHGLKPAVAAQLVAETMSGTAELLRVRDYDTLGVRREVTSPAGSTARGLDALERGGVRAAFSAAMDGVREVVG